MAITDRRDLRREHLQTVVTRIEKNLVQLAAKRAKQRVSAWIRDVLLQAVKDQLGRGE